MGYINAYTNYFQSGLATLNHIKEQIDAANKFLQQQENYMNVIPIYIKTARKQLINSQ